VTATTESSRGANDAGRGSGEQDARGTGARGNRAPNEADTNSATLFYLNELGELAALRVQTGLTNGQHTVVYSPELQEGMQVIIAATTVASNNSESSNSPFQTGNEQRGRGRGGF
jgi:hypothetical protein